MAALVPSDYRFTVEDARSGDESPRLTIVCEPTFQSGSDAGQDCQAVVIQLLPGVTIDEARQFASVLQRRVGGFCRLELRDKTKSSPSDSSA